MTDAASTMLLRQDMLSLPEDAEAMFETRLAGDVCRGIGIRAARPWTPGVTSAPVFR